MLDCPSPRLPNHPWMPGCSSSRWVSHPRMLDCSSSRWANHPWMPGCSSPRWVDHPRTIGFRLSLHTYDSVLSEIRVKVNRSVLYLQIFMSVFYHKFYVLQQFFYE